MEQSLINPIFWCIIWYTLLFIYITVLHAEERRAHIVVKRQNLDLETRVSNLEKLQSQTTELNEKIVGLLRNQPQ